MRTVCVSFCNLTLVLSYWYASDRFDLSILRTFYSIAIYSSFGTKRDFDLITPDILLSLVSVSSVVFDNLWYKLGEYPKQRKKSFLSWNKRMCIGKSAQASRTGSDYTTLTFPSIQTLPSMPIANPEKTSGLFVSLVTWYNPREPNAFNVIGGDWNVHISIYT